MPDPARSSRRGSARSGEAVVLENRMVSPGHFFIRLGPVGELRRPRPGQFFMVAVGAPGSTDPLLRRPLSLHRVFPDGSFSLLYRVVGRGTSLLSSRGVGERVRVLGPLGNGFPQPPPGSTALLVGGGIGIVPLVALAEDLKASGEAEAPPRVFLGARMAADLVCVEDMRGIGLDPALATDDGSLGRRGVVTELVEEALAAGTGEVPAYVYGCGPRPMLRTLAELMKRQGMSGVFSLEERMACGLGACLGCVVDTRGGRRRVCLEGPVFPVDELLWGVD